MRIFVTGATGFLGTHLADRLAQTPHELRCLVRSTARAKHLAELGASLVPGDVNDVDSLLSGMEGCDAAINLANIYSYWEPDRRIYRRVNVEGSRNVMECVLKVGLHKVVHVSSVVIYGKPADLPFTEDSPVGPIRFSEYARTKYEGDLIAWKLHQEKKLPLVMVYPGPILGVGDTKTTGGILADLVYRRMPARVFTSSAFTFVHVRDVAEILLRALEKEGNVGEKYLAAGETLTFQQVVDLTCELASVAMPRFVLPGSVTMANAALLTLLADVVKKPPLWGMALDGMRTIREGIVCDGTKAARELEISYTPVRVAVEEFVEALRKGEQRAESRE